MFSSRSNWKYFRSLWAALLVPLEVYSVYQGEASDSDLHCDHGKEMLCCCSNSRGSFAFDNDTKWSVSIHHSYPSWACAHLIKKNKSLNDMYNYKQRHGMIHNVKRRRNESERRVASTTCLTMAPTLYVAAGVSVWL